MGGGGEGIEDRRWFIRDGVRSAMYFSCVAANAVKGADRYERPGDQCDRVLSAVHFALQGFSLRPPGAARRAVVLGIRQARRPQTRAAVPAAAASEAL